MTRGRTSMVGGGDHHQITADTARGVDDGQAHSGDMVMPGFRFHPTEEELIEFYLRRKVEGKRFNIELIASVDLYRYDPWDLPALASIGDKEWFFYVPRDRKYRNGDRPNRVTPSGYWKATGADRLVRVDGNREIGLKKTLVFYVGKAPKGIRSSWIMNEYRLPHGEAERYQKIHQEISLCRVYKRSGIEDNFHLTTKKKHAAAHRTSSATPRLTPTMFDAGGHPSPLMGGTTTTNTGGMPLSTPTAAATRAATTMPSMFRSTAASVASLSSTTSTEEDGTSATLYHHMIKGNNNTNPAMLQHLPPSTHALLNVNSSAMASIPIDELSRAIGSYNNNQQQQQANPNNILQQAMQPSSQQSPLLPFASMEKIWDWNPLLESPKVCTSFK